MGLITNLIPGVTEVKMIIALACMTAIIGGGFWIKHERDYFHRLEQNNVTLTSNNKILQENNDVLKGNLNTCVATNTTDNTTIAGLIKERSDAKLAVDTLAAQQKSNMIAIGTLSQKLKQMEGNAANDGTLAPDLRETVRGIEMTGRK